MKNLFNIILGVVFFLPSTYVLAITRDAGYETEYSNATDTATFKRSMDQALEDQKRKIKTAKDVVFNLKAPVVPGLGDQLVQDTLMLDVKQTLYRNFINSPITQDPRFQNFILRIMNQSTITENDLKDLQRAADEAHARQRQ